MLRAVAVILIVAVALIIIGKTQAAGLTLLIGLGALVIRDWWRQRVATRGWVYVIQDPATQAVKLGMTRRPVDQRLGELTKGPVKPELLHVIPADDARAAERRLHQHFKHKRGRGEWFWLSKADISDLKSIRRM
jgi:hypothetical protein